MNLIKKYALALTMLTVMAGLPTSCSSDDDSTTTKKTDTATTTVIDSTYTYELPVIFHVLYQNQSDASQYIPYQRLADILQYVNEIYQGNVYGESQNVKLKFVLAETDENGKKLSHPGVEYVHYTGEYPIDPYSFMGDNTGTNVKYIWEPNDYINVMMYNFKSTSESQITLGISHMPYSVKGNHALEGLETVTTSNIKKRNLAFPYCTSINSMYANTDRTGLYYQSDRYTNSDHQASYIVSSDVVVTLAHELGHYLGLYHDFTEVTDDESSESVEYADSCADTDYCSDTKSYNRYEYLQYVDYLEETNPDATADDLLLRYSCDGEEFSSTNIMDYSYTLGYEISKQQKERIRNVLYYSPLIPGPKKGQSTRAAKEYDGIMDLKIRLIK